MKSKRKLIETLACAVFVLVGLAACTYGLWMAWKPLGFIFGGAVLAASAFFSAYDAADVRRMR